MKTKRKIVGLMAGLLLGGPGMHFAEEMEAGNAIEGEAANTPLASEIGILPEFKRGEFLPVDERNPYANRMVEKAAPKERGTEAARIVQLLEGLQVRGVIRDAGGQVKTVLLGDIGLSEGRDVPQVLPSQVDQLYVSKVTNSEVEITWRTEAGRVVPDGRRLAFTLDNRSKVEIVLPGQPDVAGGAKQRALLVAGAVEAPKGAEEEEE